VDAPLLKAHRDNTSFGSKEADFGMDLHNNPFTKQLFNRLGPEFDPTNLINKNRKMFTHLNMLDGVALCSESELYERTYLDRIKIGANYLQQQ